MLGYLSISGIIDFKNFSAFKAKNNQFFPYLFFDHRNVTYLPDILQVRIIILIKPIIPNHKKKIVKRDNIVCINVGKTGN